MKVALCLSGQIRSHKLVEDSVNKYLMEPYKPDVFCHFWHKYDNQKYKNFYNENCTYDYGNYDNKKIQEVIKCYNPNSLKFSSPFYNENTRSMLYSIYESNKLRVEYEKNMHIEYDVVIKSRYDILFQKKIEIDEVEDKTIYLINRPGGCGGYGDWIIYGNSKTMDFYMNCYLEYKNTQRILQPCPEGIWKEYIDSNNYRIKYIEKCFNIVREDGFLII